MLTLWKNQKGFALLGDLLIVVILVVVASVAISAIGALH
jgi:competence protein ComGC